MALTMPDQRASERCNLVSEVGPREAVVPCDWFPGSPRCRGGDSLCPEGPPPQPAWAKVGFLLLPLPPSISKSAPKPGTLLRMGPLQLGAGGAFPGATHFRGQGLWHLYATEGRRSPALSASRVCEDNGEPLPSPLVVASDISRS